MTFNAVKIKWIKYLGMKYVQMGLTCGSGYDHAMPGQFVMARVPGAVEPFLSRPFSISDVLFENGRPRMLIILFKIVGSGTLKLSRLNKGDRLEVLGPLGRGFHVPENMASVFIVSGGIGVAPMLFLLRHMAEKGISGTALSFFAGGQSRGDVLCVEELSAYKIKTHFTTDDGSLGDKGLVTGALEDALALAIPDMVYACGPLPMLKAVARLADKYAVKCQVSLETVMACGMGACLGCAVRNAKRQETYAHVCVDGPVFDLGEFGF